MKRLLTVVAVLGAGALMAALPAHAQMAGPPDTGSDQLIAVGSGMGSIKHVARVTPLGETHVGMPGPYEPEPGPVALGSQLMPSRGSAIVHPTGGRIVSPKQQADREIQKLIRKLG